MSSNPTLVAQGEGSYLLSGDLSFTTVTALLQQTRTLCNGGGSLNVDLSGVSRSDSAGVALLLEWLRLAQTQNATITFSNIPAQMWALIEVSDLDDRLPLELASQNVTEPS